MTPVYRPEDASDQFDVMRSMAIVGQRWKLVLGITVFAIIAAAIASTVAARVAPQYQSTLMVLLTGPRYKISFDPKFANVDAVSAPVASRTDEYRSIAMSPEVMVATIQMLSGKLAPSDVATVSVNVLARGQLITISATADDPNKASLVGAAYAQAAANRLDAVYGQTDQDRQAIANKLAESITAHEQAQAQLTDFTRTSQIDALSIQIAQEEATMQSLAEERASSVKNRLSGYYAILAETDQIVRAANGLRDQVQAAGGASRPASGASLALAMLQARLANLGAQTDTAHVDLSRDVPRTRETTPPPASNATNNERPAATERIPNTDFSPRATTPPQLQLQLNTDALSRTDADPNALLASIDTLIASTQAQQNDIRQAINTLSQQVASSTTPQGGDSIDATTAHLATDLSTLQASYRQQTFQRDVLTQNVEQARSTRSTLEAKLSEASVTAEAGGDGAIVASGTNAPPTQSWPPSLSRTLPLAAVAGLLIGAFIALILGRRRPGQSTPEHPVENLTPRAATVARS